MSGNFLFTWKEDHWPYEKLKALVDAFEAGRKAVEPWRCAAFRQIKIGDRAYLLKQGKHPTGIFGIGVVDGPVQNRIVVEKGERDKEVPIRFEFLVDPRKEFLVSIETLLSLSVPKARWTTQSSGVQLESEAARFIDRIVDEKRDFSSILQLNSSQVDVERRERLSEVYERDQAKSKELKRIYGNRCQICDSIPYNGKFGNIVEAHHIVWLCRGGEDSVDNMVLLCPNHHAAVHSSDPSFDFADLTFHFGSTKAPVRLNTHLKQKSA